MTQAFDPRAIEARRLRSELGAAVLKLVPRDEGEAQPTVIRVVPSPPAQVVSEPESEPLNREQRRSRRKREVRARSISVKRMTKRELEIGRMLYPETDYYKPLTRAECVDGARPCPYVSCKHHLFLDVSPKTGAIKLNYPDLDVHELVDSCALDVADRGGETLERVGELTNLTRERIRQVEVKALAKIEALGAAIGLTDHVDGRRSNDGKRRLPILDEIDEGFDP